MFVCTRVIAFGEKSLLNLYQGWKSCKMLPKLSQRFVHIFLVESVVKICSEKIVRVFFCFFFLFCDAFAN